MSYTTAQARAGILEEIAGAVAELEAAITRIGEAYELLDDASQDRLEKQLFGPLQQALARAKTTASGFAARCGVDAVPVVTPATPGLASQGVAGFVRGAVEDVEEAVMLIGELQDSMAPVEVGDAELRAGLASIREIAETIPGRATSFLRVLYR